MRGSAIYFAQQVSRVLSEAKIDPCDVNLIFTSDMTSAADLRALLPAPLPSKPFVCYFHENQLTYPLPNETDRDYQYGFTNITNCLAADAVWFNSEYHRRVFLAAVGNLLGRMPDYVPDHVVETIEHKSQVMPLGLDPALFDLKGALPPPTPSSPPTVLWNHRWEYDKNPDDFFETLFDLQRSGINFRLVVAGQSFRDSPPIFAAAQQILAERIDHFGYVPNRQAYYALLARADIVVSTAHHEFFGLSAAEGIASGCYPLLPNRLNYPELLPVDFHACCIYNSVDELRTKLTDLCRNGVTALPSAITKHVSPLSWPRTAESYDEEFRLLST
jgi:glycosyltransferase involved in cell wall biosynthesis